MLLWLVQQQHAVLRTQCANMQEKVVAMGKPRGPRFSLLLGDFLRKKLQSKKTNCKFFRFSRGILNKKCLLPTITTIRTDHPRDCPQWTSAQGPGRARNLGTRQHHVTTTKPQQTRALGDKHETSVPLHNPRHHLHRRCMDVLITGKENREDKTSHGLCFHP